MAAVDVRARDNPPVNDDLDNLFNYDVDTSLFQDVDTNMDVAPQQPAATSKGKGAFDDRLGLDEEIKVTKKKAPIAKLDENRLLSQNGIPKLRRIAKERLRFKGKGHEFSDIARLLNVYQLWLDDLYPRAKFADGLAMIEKLGHTKRMQAMRKEWINEGKARHTSHNGGDRHRETPERRLSGVGQKTLLSRGPEGPGSSGGPKAQDKEAMGRSAEDSLFLSDEEDAAEGPPEDDLDAILAEEDTWRDAKPKGAPDTMGAGPPNTFADDEEAMADMW